MKAEQGAAGDVEVILGWLKAEYDADGEGFESNRNVIAEAVENDGLWVVRDPDGAVAYLVRNG